MSPNEIVKVTCDWNSIRVEISGIDGITVFNLTADKIMDISNAFEKVLFIPHPTIHEPPPCGGLEK